MCWTWSTRGLVFFSWVHPLLINIQPVEQLMLKQLNLQRVERLVTWFARSLDLQRYHVTNSTHLRQSSVVVRIELQSIAILRRCHHVAGQHGEWHLTDVRHEGYPSIIEQTTQQQSNNGRYPLKFFEWLKNRCGRSRHEEIVARQKLFLAEIDLG